jgi:Bacterial regulatory proteins, tetR family
MDNRPRLSLLGLSPRTPLLLDRKLLVEPQIPEPRARRGNAESDLKRALILDAACTVFEAQDLDSGSLRAIATAAGYTPAGLYFHFDSKEGSTTGSIPFAVE